MDFGTHLKAAREARRVTLEAVWANTKIERRLLMDLEANDLSRWPKDKVFRHGHVRSYAKAVGLSPDDLVRQFDREFAVEEASTFVRAPVTESRSSRFRLSKSAFALAIAAGSLVGVGLTVIDRREPGISAPTAPRIARRDSNIFLPADQAALSVAASPSPSADAPAAVSEREAQAAVEGEIQIVSSPPKAWVTINGNAYGSTPLRARYLPLGSYTIRLIQPGYSIGETRVALTAAQPNRAVKVALLPDATLVR
jgi:cytoskeleton protein RodZ